MKVKKVRSLPKEIKICGKIWDIKYNRQMSGGKFEGAKSLMSIGTRYRQDVNETLIHEIVESLLTELRYRYTLYHPTSNDGIRFVMNHKEFENFILNLTDIFNQLMEDK